MLGFTQDKAWSQWRGKLRKIEALFAGAGTASEKARCGSRARTCPGAPISKLHELQPTRLRRGSARQPAAIVASDC
jgi:hypothetical protein